LPCQLKNRFEFNEIAAIKAPLLN